MAYDGDSATHETNQEDLLYEILRELKKIVLILNEGHDLNITNGDVDE